MLSADQSRGGDASSVHNRLDSISFRATAGDLIGAALMADYAHLMKVGLAFRVIVSFAAQRV